MTGTANETASAATRNKEPSNTLSLRIFIIFIYPPFLVFPYISCGIVSVEGAETTT